jgi:hypothetical protein
MSLNTAQKKILIEQALSTWFSDDALQEAVIIWELRYSRQPALAFQRYVSDICTTPALLAQRPRIVQALIRALTDETGKLRQAVQEETKPAVASAPAADAETVRGFVQLVDTVFAHTPSDMSARLRELLLEKSRTLDLSQPAQAALRAWLEEGGGTPQDVFIGEPALQALVQAVHAGLCEFLSRPRADRLLQEALQQAESHYRGRFPLRRLWAA